jgi:hypothetical protein
MSAIIIKIPAQRRAVFLNALNSALPQLMGNESEPGLWPSLAPILGAKSFHKENEDQRWEVFFNSGSAWAEALRSEITRVRDPFDQKLWRPQKKATAHQKAKVLTSATKALAKESKRSLNCTSWTIFEHTKPKASASVPQTLVQPRGSLSYV